MHSQLGSSRGFAESRAYRFAGAAAAVLAWAALASAGWCWFQLADRLLELPGLTGAFQDWATELMSPDALMRRTIKQTTRG